MSNTQENIEAAFAGESQASQRYLHFAERAEEEGHPQIARLFRAAAEAETVHARNHLEVMGGIGSTTYNLEEAISGEGHEFREMYPAFIEQAKQDGNRRAEISFTFAGKVEEIHHELYQKALEVLEAGEQLKDEPYFVCPVCGNTVESKAPERCPVCGAPGDKFKRVE